MTFAAAMSRFGRELRDASARLAAGRLVSAKIHAALARRWLARAGQLMVVVCLLSSVLELSGCASVPGTNTAVSETPTRNARTYWVEALPDWRTPADAAPVSQQQIFARVAEELPSAPVLLSDATFTRVNREFVGELIAWTRSFLVETNRASRDGTRTAYIPESFDCDKFAKAFSLAVEMSASRAGLKAQPLVARIFVNQAVAFGGVPAGGGHALIAIATDGGIIVVEPQSGASIPWEQYPNRTSVWRITIGG